MMRRHEARVGLVLLRPPLPQNLMIPFFRSSTVRQAHRALSLPKGSAFSSTSSISGV
jgi:hypothetical protein